MRLRLFAAAILALIFLLPAVSHAQDHSQHHNVFKTSATKVTTSHAMEHPGCAGHEGAKGGKTCHHNAQAGCPCCKDGACAMAKDGKACPCCKDGQCPMMGGHAGHGMQADHSGHGSGVAETPAIAEMNAAMEVMHRDMMVSPTGDADADFIRGMIPHHQGAIDMAEIVLRHGDDPQARQLAKTIIRAQKGEIALMRKWLALRQIDEKAPMNLNR